jgi:hypothetical protein
MRLADDRRGRVPFALVGVVLLVGSAAFSAGLATRGPTVEDHSVDDAMERTAATTVSVLRAAADDAARNAGREPVTDPAETDVGRVLNETGTFRDYLRVRIYLAARHHLQRSERRVGGVTAVSSLPATPDPAALRAAKRRVAVEAVDGGASLRVTVENVTRRARRDGRVVARERTSVTVTVSNPVLALHDRTETYQRRLARGPLEGAGLGRRLTARLYPVAWARGYAQYGGLPIDTVLANRHVALSSNGAALQLQRATFGRADPDGWRGLRRATARTAVTDALGPTPLPGGRVADAIPSPNDPVEAWNETAAESAPVATEREFRATAEAAADRAYLAFVAGDDRRTLEDVLESSYEVDARLTTDVRTRRSERRPEPAPPGDDWTLVDERVDRRVTVESVGDDAASLDSAVGPREFVAANVSRRVVEESTVERRWTRGPQITWTRAEWTNEYRVDAAVVVEPPRGGDPPRRPTRPLFERGGALSGPNLADTPERAAERLVDEEDGPDAVARRVALGEPTTAATVRGERPDALRDWVVRDLASLRERVRTLSVNVSSDDVASGRANPQAALADLVEERRSALIDAPDAYDGVADRARVAARAAYLDAVVRQLERNADRTRAANGEFDSKLRETELESAATLGKLYEQSRERPAGTSGARAEAAARTEPVAMVPDAEPAYLSLSGVSGDASPAVAPGRTYHPLAARNVNLFAVPYGDATDAVLDAALGSDRSESVPLRTASRALVTANRTLKTTANETLERRRDALRTEVSGSLRAVEENAKAALVRHTDLSQPERLEVLAAARAEWPDTGRRGLAAANGSYARTVVTEAKARTTLDPVEADTLAVAVRADVRRAADGNEAWVSQPATDRTVDSARRLARRGVSEAVAAHGPDAVQAAKDRWVGDALGNVPAGVPLLPAPGYWYATVNVWTVTVRGSYAQFAVRTPRATPATPGVGTTYVRDGDAVALDVDDDGVAERLGRGERLTFSVQTAVVVAVPPSGNGVGDVGGDADERSAGWPTPGYASAD